MRKLLDWKNKIEYAYVDSLSNAGLAWEFLRRNPEYSKTWRKYLSIKSELDAKFGPSFSWSSSILQCREISHFDPPIKASETESEWIKRNLDSGVDPYRSPFVEGLARSWGLVRLLNPAQVATGKERFLAPRFNVWYHVDDIEMAEPYPAKWKRAYIEIDLSRHIEPQLDLAKARLLKSQRELIKRCVLAKPTKKTPKKKLFSRYLRVLDAFATNPRPTRMAVAACIFGTDYRYKGERGLKAIDETRKQASRMVLNDYRSLI